MQPVAVAAVLLLASVSAPPPDVVVGPGLATQAVAVAAPIAAVTVYSDRAEVVRRADTAMRKGTQAVRLPDLPGAVHLDTVRVAASGRAGARVLRVEATPVERERYSLEQIEGLIEKLEALRDELATLDGIAQAVQAEVAFLGALQPSAPVPEHERVGKALPAILPGVWTAVADFVDARRVAARARLSELRAARREVARKAEAIRREVDRHDLGAVTDKRVQVLAVLDAKRAGPARLELSYFVPGAHWLPAYELRFSDDLSEVAILSAGLVQQATGEDWSDVSLALSTSVPGRSIELPELLTWTLGEKREFVPRPRAARRPPSPPRLARPAPVAGALEATRTARVEALRSRIAELRRLSKMDLSEKSAEVAQVRGLGDRRKKRRARRRPPPPSARPQASPPRPARAPQPSPSAAPAMLEMEATSDEEVSLLGGLFGGASRSSASSKPRVNRTSLGLFEPSYYRPPRLANRKLPAVVAGGLDYVYRAPVVATIPSSDERVRVPLAAERFPTEVFYEATPSLSTTAYLKATVRNGGRRPILAGDATLFVGGEFGGDTHLSTTGPGDVLELPLGADEDVRLVHTLVPASETTGFVSKREVTRYTTTIEVGNYKKRPIRVRLTDQVPKSTHEDVRIKTVRMDPKPDKGPDAGGVFRWALDVPAGGTARTTLVYTIDRPKDWKLRQH